MDWLRKGGLALLPFAPIAAVSGNDLPRVVPERDRRIAAEADPQQARELWTATYLRMGARYSAELTKELLRGVRQMRNSTTYQAILREGWEEGCQGILRPGRNRFGEPSASVQERLNPLPDCVALEERTERLLEAGFRDELLLGE